ncbi:MAG: hydroxymethylglutaryl-CoA lyase [Planctomycetota bacterium]|jgi:hydroxymethylglutaryl-CoA lyase
MPGRIRITEVGPRDGLQNEPGSIPASAKIRFVELLAASGLASIEVSSFVSPKWVPQLADADDVFAGIARPAGVIYSALVPNERGMERALAAHAAGKLDAVAVFTAASKTFSRRNTNASIEESIVRFGPVVAQAKDASIPVRGYISCVVACPYEGPIDGGQVRDVAARLLEIGVDEIDLGETIGVAAPNDIEGLYDDLEDLLEPADTTLHLHDTRGTALACALRAMEIGVVSFDASCAGLGGCPYAPGAAGNLATEDLVYLCARMGIETGIDLEKLFEAGRHIAESLGRTPSGRVFRADGAANP